MKLENQVCSLDLAKRLKELGVKQNSLFVWVPPRAKEEEWFLSTSVFALGIKGIRVGDGGTSLASAFTVAELGEMLHAPLRQEGMMNAYYPNAFITYFPEPEKRWVIGNEYPLAEADWKEYAPTEADARAKMLAYLIENKFITI